MRFFQGAATGCVLCLATASLVAQQKATTDAQMDGFSGPVKSVVTTIHLLGLNRRQPDGPALVWPIPCRDCEYAPDGSRMKEGVFQSGSFLGSFIFRERDGSNRVVRQRYVDANTGALQQEIAFGPFGRTEETWYADGKIREREHLWYDSNGHLSDVIDWDADGKESRRGHVVYSKEGVLLNDTSWQKDVLFSRYNLDPASKTETFATFDEAGGVKVTWTIRDKKLVDFHETSPGPNQYGDGWSDDDDPNDLTVMDCHTDGHCDRNLVHYEFIDSARRNLKSAEWRDSDGNVLYGAYYEYELGAHGDWTNRKIFVTDREHPDRSLLEEDTRTTSYWR